MRKIIIYFHAIIFVRKLSNHLIVQQLTQQGGITDDEYMWICYLLWLFRRNPQNIPRTEFTHSLFLWLDEIWRHVLSFPRLDFEIINCLLANDFSAADILRFRKGINDNKHIIKKIIEDELIIRTKTHCLTPNFLKTADMILHTDYEIPVNDLLHILHEDNKWFFF